MKFLTLDAENVLRLNAFHVDLSGVNVVEFTSEGKNAVGKTSAIRAMMALILGKRSIPDKLLKEGTNKGYIEGTLGEGTETELVVRLDVTPRGEKLTVKGAKSGTPQAILDAMNAHLGFNPLKFIEMGNTAEGRRKQLDVIATLIGFDIEEHENQVKAIYDEREKIGRDKKRLGGLVESLPIAPADTPRSEVSVSELTEELSAAMTAESAATDRARRIESAKQRIAAAQADLEAFEGVEAVKIPDIEALKERVANAETVNKNVRMRKTRLEANNEFNAVCGQYEDYTVKLDDLKAKKDKATREANLPVEGLSFDLSGLLLNDVPLQQASSAEKIKVACSILIEAQQMKAEATGSDPLRVILIEEASLLGDDMYGEIAELAEKHDYQVILETVRQIGDCAIVIQDGEVKE